MGPSQSSVSGLLDCQPAFRRCSKALSDQTPETQATRQMITHCKRSRRGKKKTEITTADIDDSIDSVTDDSICVEIKCWPSWINHNTVHLLSIKTMFNVIKSTSPFLILIHPFLPPFLPSVHSMNWCAWELCRGGMCAAGERKGATAPRQSFLEVVAVSLCGDFSYLVITDVARCRPITGRRTLMSSHLGKLLNLEWPSAGQTRTHTLSAYTPHSSHLCHVASSSAFSNSRGCAGLLQAKWKTPSVE